MATEHPGHPGMDHCSGCSDEVEAGWDDGLWTLDDARPTCCCRDERDPRQEVPGLVGVGSWGMTAEGQSEQ